MSLTTPCFVDKTQNKIDEIEKQIVPRIKYVQELTLTFRSYIQAISNYSTNQSTILFVDLKNQHDSYAQKLLKKKHVFTTHSIWQCMKAGYS